MAEFYLLGNSTHSQMFGAVILTDKHTVVIDGGTAQDDGQLVRFLTGHGRTHVDAWFFTHPHHDHIGCFVNIRKNAPQITVARMCHRFPEEPILQNYARTDFEKALIQDFWAISRRDRASNICANDTFQFDDVSIRVLRVFNPEITNNFINNSSAVYRIDGQNGSFLILGDLGVEGGNEVMDTVPLALLTTDYTQMAHHGQNGVSREFYNHIKPNACIWPAPDWLWNNDRGEGFDTGPWQTVRTREWIAALGITKHIIEKDGIQKIIF